MAPVTALALLCLAGCGVDGEPTKPEPKPDTRPAPGLTITGRAEVGVSKSW